VESAASRLLRPLPARLTAQAVVPWTARAGDPTWDVLDGDRSLPGWRRVRGSGRRIASAQPTRAALSYTLPTGALASFHNKYVSKTVSK